MTNANEIRKEQIRRFDELMMIARQRFLDAGGDPRYLPSGMKGDDYMTDEERQEALSLGRALFNDEYIKSFLEKRRKKSNFASKLE